ncbi:VWA domain-containing protein [Helicobacter canis]|uniref:Magnesium chelatase subunit D n=1 Tax=Helicobacter canis TaxID=29419 RepID=A0A377J2M6_9HELI|nr:VWA domain-containing protein [Helicobacter canis]STO96752.1 magnesium chelatase subunit D [Helicobacter canis]
MKNLSKILASLAILVAVGIGIFSCLPPQKSSQEVPNMVDMPHHFESAHRPNISRAYDMGKVAPPTMRSAPIDIARVKSTDSFAQKDENSFKLVANNPLSTFSSDVDTASYAIVRKVIESGRLPSPDMVRIEELLNSFSYSYQAPKGDEPISINLELAPALWNPAHKIARIGLQAKAIDWDKRKPFNLVFLIDTSGSMAGENRLGLVQKSLKLLVENLSSKDSVGIVTYAGSSTIALKPTNDKKKILKAIDSLSAGGSTHGSAGIEDAYELAQKHFIQSGYNRVILATDGDFNVGITSESELLKLIKQKAQSGIYLSVFGYGMGNYKDSMLQKLADSGNGNYGYIDTLLEAKKHLVEQVGATLITVAKDVKIQVEFNPAKVAAYRLIGYEKRVLNDEDFNDDSKDAGEMGSSHRVTALYEIVPVGVESSLATLNNAKLAPDVKGIIDPLKYPQTTKTQSPSQANSTGSAEWLNVKIRYKEPANKARNDESSKPIEQALDSSAILATPSADMRFAQSVAGFGLLLMDSKFVDSSFRGIDSKNSAQSKSGYQTILDTLSQQGVCDDSYKQEFLGLVAKASRLANLAKEK